MVRLLLIAEEMRLKSKALALPIDSSSPVGSCRYGDSCRYAHDANARVSITNSGINKGRGTSDNTTHDLLNKLLTQLGNLGMNVAMSQNGTVPNSTTIASNNTASPGNSLGPHAFFASPNPSPGPNITAPPGFPPMAQAHVPTYFTAANNTNQAHVTPSTTTGLVMQPTGYVSHALGPVMQSGAGTNSGQATLLPQAFIAGTLHDLTTGAYNMDTGLYLFDAFLTLIGQMLCKQDEYNALIKNRTWTLVPRPSDANVVRCMWLFRHKFLTDGTLSRYKARLMANSSTQLEGVDVDETFSPVVKPVSQDSSGMFLSQKKYAVKILERANMVNCNPSRTHVDTDSKMGNAGDEVFDPTLYISLASSLQYLSFTRPNISYAVQPVCLHMHDPWEPHFSALKWILRYIRGTLEHGLQLFSSTTSNLVAYSDADWAGCPTTQRFILGYCVFLATIYSPGPLSVNRRFLAPVLRLSIRVLLMLLLKLVGCATYCRTKHIEIDIHFVRNLVAAGQKFLSDETLAIPLDEIQINDKLQFTKEPVEIMDREVKHLKQSRISIVKVMAISTILISSDSSKESVGTPSGRVL
ncbi:ribonuclease H-like domain-containing protein [Tanacetum coccineum]